MPLIGLLIAGAVGVLLAGTALWIGEHWDDKPSAAAAERAKPSAPRSPTELFLDGGGDLSNPRVAALLAEAERGWNRHHGEPAAHATRTTPQGATPIHAHEITPDDAAMIRMMTGAHFGPDATVTLPSGRTITGTEMQQWIEAND